MLKIVLNKEATDNLFRMLSSEDDDNHYLALKTIEKLDISESIGFIMLLYKYGRASSTVWREACPLIWEKFCAIHLIDKESNSPTASRVLRTMIAQQCDMEAIAFFIKLQTNSLVETLSAWGYDTDQFDIQINLKEHEQQS